MLLSVLVAVPIMFMAPAAFPADNEPLVVKSSPHDVPTTVSRLEAAVNSRGASVVAKIDHAAAAQAAGLSLRPTVLVLFGNPKLGTPLMQSQQTAGLDLPLRVLVWQDAAGTTQVGYAPPAVIAARHGITDRNDDVDKMTGVLAAITGESLAP
ncbi:MAG: DUF302 domain-containing protein [Rhodospirillales bacterium]|nr:DUF302 domain-containing protein [Rhodospirillales bacterium]